MGTDFLHIPPTIRREYIPFKFESGKYSFKPEKGSNLIYPFSSNLSRFFEQDSFLPDSIKNYNSFVSAIPTVQIREYQPDARLTQTMKWFSYFKKGLDAGMKSAEGDGTLSFAQVKEKAIQGIKDIEEALKKFTSGQASLLNKIGNLADYTDLLGKGGTAPGAVLTVPWILYYQLNTTTTTNVYEIPALWNTGAPLFKSDGHYGYKNASLNSLSEILGMSSNNGIGKVLEMAGLNEIKVHKMPVFNPEGEFTTDNIEVTFTLVNDSEAAAANNFIFLHNLIGQNRWVQYGFVQASASVYDVVLPGANRYWMCSGNFSVIPKGILRVPSSTVKQAINSKGINAHQNFESMNILTDKNAVPYAEEKDRLHRQVRKARLENTQYSKDVNTANSKIESNQRDADSAAAALQRPGPSGPGYFLNESGQEITDAEIGAQIQQALDNKKEAEEQKAAAEAAILENEKKIAEAEARLKQISTDIRAKSEAEHKANVGYMLEKIKIPDAYEVKLNFKPLLPDNFNNFLYGWRAGMDWDIMDGTKTAPGTQRDWVFEKMVQEIVKAFGG